MEAASALAEQDGLSADASRSLLWQAGIVAPWYLRPSQLEIYELLLRDKNPFIEAARRFGKTTTILCYVIELLLRNPGWICVWCEPDKNQAREIVKPELSKIFRSAPPYYRPKWNTEDSFYWFPSTGSKDHASKLKLRGVNHDMGDSARGPEAHIIVADEFGFWKDPNYIVNSALDPQLQTTNGPFIFASTPPPDLGHTYYKRKSVAVAQDRFIQKIITDNESLTPERLEELKEKAGGEDSEAWQREYLCRRVGDSKLLVLPEFRYPLVEVPDDYKRPEYFDSYVGGDSGADDNTALLFGYYDFANDIIVIEDEWIGNGKTTEIIVKEAKAIEDRLWNKKPPLMRVYDADKQILIDMCNHPHGYTAHLPEKSDRIAAIRALRIRIKQGKFKVHARCKILLNQMEVGQWANDKHLDFQRSEAEEIKHLDAIAAAVYFNRSVITSRNPFPRYSPDVSVYTHHIPESHPQGSSDDAAFAAALDPLAEGF